MTDFYVGHGDRFQLGDRVVLKHGVDLGYKHPPRIRGHIIGFGYSGGLTIQLYVDAIYHPVVRLSEVEHESVVDRLGRVLDE